MFANLLRKISSLTRQDDLRIVRAAGRVWRLSQAGAELFGANGPDLEGWSASGAAAVVKSNHARTVYRVKLPGVTIFVKHCKISGARAWAREAIRPPKAQLEFENTQALRERGVAAIEPLAWGGPDSYWPSESFLITRELSHTIPFLYFLEHVLPSLPPEEHRASRRQVARSLGQFVARLHDAGVAHPDPHPGNLLIEMPPSRVPHFALIDLHAVGVGQPLSWSASKTNLILFNRWFQLRASRVDRARFWHAYRSARMTLAAPSPEEMSTGAKQLEQGTIASNLRFWAGREGRCLGTNRYYRQFRRGAFRGHAVRDLPEDFFQALLTDPDGALKKPCIPVLKDSRTSTVAVLTMPTAKGPVPVVLKRTNLRSWIEPFKNLARPSQALRSWVGGHSLRDRCLPTPRPLAMFHRYRFGLPVEGYLLTELAPDPSALDGFDKQAALKLARLLRAMHDRGVSHRDLKAANILMVRKAEPVLIDLVGVRVRSRVSERHRAKELARLNASFLNSSVSLTTRLRFLRAYLAAGAGSRVDWKSWWRMIFQATAEKVAKNRRNGRTLG